MAEAEGAERRSRRLRADGRPKLNNARAGVSDESHLSPLASSPLFENDVQRQIESVPASAVGFIILPRSA